MECVRDAWELQDDSFLETLHTAYLSKLRMDGPAENP